MPRSSASSSAAHGLAHTLQPGQGSSQYTGSTALNAGHDMEASMHIQVDAERCTGCGDCIDTCPNDALSLEGGRAVVDQVKCAGCQTCADVCPTGAIIVVEEPDVEVVPIPAQLHREAEIITSQPGQLKPWLGTLLDFATREILPRLFESLTLALERRTMQTPDVSTQAPPVVSHVETRQRSSGQARRQRRVRERGRRKGSGRRAQFRYMKGGEEHAAR